MNADDEYDHNMGVELLEHKGKAQTGRVHRAHFPRLAINAVGTGMQRGYPVFIARHLVAVPVECERAVAHPIGNRPHNGPRICIAPLGVLDRVSVQDQGRSGVQMQSLKARPVWRQRCAQTVGLNGKRIDHPGILAGQGAGGQPQVSHLFRVPNKHLANRTSGKMAPAVGIEPTTN